MVDTWRCETVDQTYEDTTALDNAPLHDDTETWISGEYHTTETIHIFIIPEAEDVLPSRRNQGLNPSEDPARMILRCWIERETINF